MQPHLNKRINRPYELQEYNPKWKQRFINVSEKIRPVFGDNLVEIDHVGSTSIEGMVAKPQIDILVVVKNLDLVKDYYDEFSRLGFTSHGRGYVRDDDEYITEDEPSGNRLTSIHIYEAGNPKIISDKIFRDYLIQNKEDRDLYIQTKRDAYTLYKDDYTEYIRAKDGVLEEIKVRAKKWSEKSMPTPDPLYVYHGSPLHFEEVVPKRQKRMNIKREIIFDEVSFHATPYKWIALSYSYTSKPYPIDGKTAHYHTGVSLYNYRKFVSVLGFNSLEESLKVLYGDGGYLLTFKKEDFFHKEGLGDLEVITKTSPKPVSIEFIKDPVAEMRKLGVTFEFIDLADPKEEAWRNYS